MSEVPEATGDDVFFIWKGTKDELELFVWHSNEVEMQIQFQLQLELEREGFLPFLDVGISKSGGKLVTKAHTAIYHWASNHPKIRS